MSKKKYVLTGLYSKPCTHGGVKTHPAEGNLPERKEVVHVPFKPGEITETDLDMSSAERSGFIRCVGNGDAKPASVAPAEKPIKTTEPLTEKEQAVKEEADAKLKEAANQAALDKADEDDAAAEEEADAEVANPSSDKKKKKKNGRKNK